MKKIIKTIKGKSTMIINLPIAMVRELDIKFGEQLLLTCENGKITIEKV